MSENIRPDGATLESYSSATIVDNTSGRGKLHPLPPGVAGWSWGAFSLTWIWAVCNRTWLGLLAFVPGIGFIVPIMLGIKGREWAWRNKRWDSLEHFNRVQRRWSLWGGTLFLAVPLLGIVAAIAIPAYQDYALKRPLAAALAYAGNTSDAVGHYIESNHTLPQSLDAIHPVAPRPASIQDIMIDRRSGRLKVTLDVGYLRGKAFYLAPSVEGGKIGWRCLHGDVPLRLMPEQCKYDTADPFSL